MDIETKYNELFDNTIKMLAELKGTRDQAREMAAQEWAAFGEFEKWQNLAELIESREWLKDETVKEGRA